MPAGLEEWISCFASPRLLDVELLMRNWSFIGRLGQAVEAAQQHILRPIETSVFPLVSKVAV